MSSGALGAPYWMAKVCLFCFILGCSAFGQIPDAPSTAKKSENVYFEPLRHPEFYVGVGVFSASAIADVHSTKACERNLTCVEAYKGHDRYGFIAPQIAFVAMGTYGCELMLYDHKWFRRFICPGIGIGWSIQHWKDASTIYKNDLTARP